MTTELSEASGSSKLEAWSLVVDGVLGEPVDGLGFGAQQRSRPLGSSR
jgi:hypothetical protein